MTDETMTARKRAIIDRARRDGALPEVVELGTVFRRIAMLMVDGGRYRVTAHDHTRIEILGVPGGRNRRYSYVKLDPKGMGNGRADRQIHRCDLTSLARHYEVVPDA